MTEGMPPTAEEIRQLNRDLMEKVLDKAESDAEWKQRLLDAPEAAMMEAGFPEARQLRKMLASVEAEEAEVTGQQGRDVCFLPFTAACRYTSSNPIGI